MLQQTQVKTVMPYWERWMRELPTIAALATASPEKIHKLWEGLGYYTRVRNMQKAAQQIVSQKKSETPRVVSYEFPENFEEILALPGIGRYTAGAICSIAFNQATPILDGNVIRVFTRVFGVGENPREKKANAKLWTLAEQLVVQAAGLAAPKRREGGNSGHASPCSHLNQSLMELGALICTPREPKCSACPISKHCFAFQKNRMNEFPNLDKRPAATARRFAAFVVEDRGCFLVRQRPAGVLNAHLWEFPNIELNGAPLEPKAAAREVLGFAPKELKPLCTIKHSITRYRITMEAFRVGAPVNGSRKTNITTFMPGRCPALREQWLPLSELHKLSFPSAHKKILHFVAAGKTH
jgi:A/G-specific adenine glycosylase